MGRSAKGFGIRQSLWRKQETHRGKTLAQGHDSPLSLPYSTLPPRPRYRYSEELGGNEGRAGRPRP